MSTTPQFTLLFDSECPFCRREVEWLKRRDRDGHLGTVDIAAPSFDPSRFGLTRQEVVAELHGVLPSGRVTRGMESVRQSWRAVGLGWVTAPTGWPLLRHVFDLGYRLFARYRVPLGRWLGRRCSTGSCKAGS